MDLKKREAFEAWFIENGILIDTDFNVAKRAFEAGAAWQAAKAKAIPDGFVAVPKEPTQELLNKMQDYFVGAFENGLTGGQSIHCAYRAVIEAAQESGND